jgi:hypothetical protein
MKRVILLFIAILTITLSSFATTVERLTLDDMVRKAHTIVHGKVRSSSAHWSADHRVIVTTTTIDIEETIKGGVAKTIELTTLGGKVGNLTLVVPGMPAFQSGEDAFLFVENVGTFKTVVGLSQGKFSVRSGRVSNTTSGLSFADGRQGDVPLSMGLEDFKRQIRNRLN